MVRPPAKLGAAQELAQPIVAVATLCDRLERVQVEEALRRERLRRMAAVAGLQRKRVPQRLVDAGVVGEAPGAGLERAAGEHLLRHVEGAAGADVGGVIDDELRQRRRAVEGLVRRHRRPRRREAGRGQLPLAQLPGRAERGFVGADLRERLGAGERVGQRLERAVVVAAERARAERVPAGRPRLPVVRGAQRRQRVLKGDGHQAGIAGRGIDETVDEAAFALRAGRQVEATRDRDQPERRLREVERTVGRARPRGEELARAGAIVHRARREVGAAE